MRNSVHKQIGIYSEISNNSFEQKTNIKTERMSDGKTEKKIVSEKNW